jgi:Cu+-exporting ATPase
MLILQQGKRLVSFDTKRINISDIIKIIKDLGYGADISKNITTAKEEEYRINEIKSLRRELIISVLLSSPLIIAMVLTLLI